MTMNLSSMYILKTLLCICVCVCMHAHVHIVKEREMDVTLRGKLCFLKRSSLKPVVNFLSTAFTGAPE